MATALVIAPQPEQWYLSPAALAILARIKGKPETETQVRRYVTTEDRWNVFVGTDYEALHNLWSEAFHEGEVKGGADRVCRVTAEDVIGALYGDPDGNEVYRTYRDQSPEWAGLRAEIENVLQWEACKQLADKYGGQG